MSRGTEEALHIEYGVVPNARTGHGWLPVIWENGRLRGDLYAARGFDREDALRRAHEEAEEHAARFIGDWSVTISERKLAGGLGTLATARLGVEQVAGGVALLALGVVLWWLKPKDTA